MKHLYKLVCLIFTLSLLVSIDASAQTILVYSEDFENGPGSFVLNTGSVGDSIGPNQWIVNNEYNGQPIYPNTISQDSTVGGLINFAPFSNYLHIHDSEALAANGIGNSNFNTTITSDNFTETGNFCTLGLDSVRIAFYFNCIGNAGSYAELWYQADNGPWTQMPNGTFNNTNQWNYAEFYDPNLNNKNDLKFGFRWINGNGSEAPTASMGVDGIRIVGVYSPDLYNVRIELDSITPNPVCKGDGVLLFFNNPVPLCGTGFYEVQLSNQFESFGVPTSLGIFQLNNENTNPLLFTLPFPTTLNNSPCYRIRVVRVDITPFIVSDTSICIEVIDCPNIISTLQPAVLSNPLDTICIGSVIDVPFYSEGVYVNNTYVAQLSDSTGLFPLNPNVIGFITDNTEYPPGTIPRGNVPGLIRVQNQPIPPGCNYYIRVVASNPSTIGSVYGPFCIRECDIETNNKLDVSVCITDVVGADTSLTVEIAQYDPPASYIDPNDFQIQLLDFQTFGVINTGVVGTVEALNDTVVSLTIPPLPQLFTIGIIPGNYYMRVVATNSTQPWDTLGTLIRLTVGAPNPSPLSIQIADQNNFFLPVAFDGDTTICLNEAIYFFVSPYNSQSSYVWGLNNDANFFEGGPYNPILFNSLGNYNLSVTETNFGCVGPGSAPTTITVLGPPNVTIVGPGQVCAGDSAIFNVQLNEGTYYSWDVSPGEVVDTLSNQAELAFPTSGTAVISISAVNECGNAVNDRNVFVRQPPQVELGNDTTICGDAEFLFESPTGPNYTYNWAENGNTVSNQSTHTLIADTTITLRLRVTNYGSLACETIDSITVNVEKPDSGIVRLFEICEGESVVLKPDTTADTYTWNTGDITSEINAQDTGWYYVTMYFNNEICPLVDSFQVKIKVCYQPLILVNVYSPNGDGTNDDWVAKQTYQYEEFSLVIFNRWGQKVFESTDPFFKWDGTNLNGNDVPDGTYFYIARLKHFENSDEQKGTVTLLR
jgi:gliding motility-associated-like protein